MTIFTNNGSASNPAVTNTNDNNTGIFYPDTDQIAFTTGGAERVRVNNTGIVTPAGTATSPAISPTGDGNTGIYFPAADTTAFSEGGVEALRITDQGNLGIGTTNIESRLEVVGDRVRFRGTPLVITDGGFYTNPSGSLLHIGHANRTNAITFLDSSFTPSGYVQTNAGILELGGRVSPTQPSDKSAPQFFLRDQHAFFPTTTTTASGANAVLSGTGRQLLVSTSSIRYKKDVEDIDLSMVSNFIEKSRPIWYRSLANHDPSSWSWYGLIAEEVAEIEPRLVNWVYKKEDLEEVEIDIEVTDDQGNPKTVKTLEVKPKQGAQKIPDGVQYDRIVVFLITAIKELKRELEFLRQELTSTTP